MEQFLVSYLSLITSWWWISAALIAFTYLHTSVLREADGRLGFFKALQLTFVGWVGMVPIVAKAVPSKLQLDFITRWILLDLGPFWQFTAVMLLFCIGLGPIAAIIVFGARAVGVYFDSAFAHDVSHYGLKKTIRLWITHTAP
ncbi:MAG: hypothetical protein KC877_01190 [Candidatus Kaiserbacteria bacterium]|nr:hypothetical protein [Candidatus Kaiserbacteria bacterium]MCB9816518.1 hypothetical protein [Candidatus Nomurabacteria bacterium]